MWEIWPNLLDEADTTLPKYHAYSLNAKVSGAKTLKVVLKSIGSAWAMQGDLTISNCTIVDFNESFKSQEFTVTQNNKSSDLQITFTIPGKVYVEYYVDGETIPSRVRELIIV